MQNLYRVVHVSNATRVPFQVLATDDWIDNQEACMLMDVSPGKMLQLRRSRAIPYSYIDRKVYYKRQDIIRFMENNIHRITL